MKELLLNFSIGIVSGTFAGMLSSFLVYLFSERRNKVRKIIEYAEQTAEKAFHVNDEATVFSGDDSVEKLRMLLKRDVRRAFPGEIVDGSESSKRLQEAIAKCNSAMYRVETALESNNKIHSVFLANSDLNDALLEIWNATTNYDVEEDLRIGKYKKYILIGIPIILLISITGIVSSLL